MVGLSALHSHVLLGSDKLYFTFWSCQFISVYLVFCCFSDTKRSSVSPLHIKLDVCSQLKAVLWLHYILGYRLLLVGKVLSLSHIQ